ncbi:hypothetical protein Bca101_037178 [Brassica carinata]
MDKGGKENDVSSVSGVEERGQETTFTFCGTQREKSVSREAFGVGQAKCCRFGISVHLTRGVSAGSIQSLHDDIKGMKARFTTMEEDVTLVKRASVNLEPLEEPALAGLTLRDQTGSMM